MTEWDSEEEKREMLAGALDLSELEKPEVREAVKKAGLVFGFDSSRDNERVLFYGDGMLKDIAKGRDSEWDGVEIVSFKYNQTTTSLENLVAAVRVLKGSCCYK